ncbi:hypothetical protein, partial [Escherichia coli]|uniref:hypothetical protein n=1 Tax=Escherichia coli TaxID=562 RepID=UPI0032DA0E5A
EEVARGEKKFFKLVMMMSLMIQDSTKELIIHFGRCHMRKGSMGDNILFERVQIKFKVIRRKQKMKNGHEYFIQERWAQDSGKNIKSSMKTKLFLIMLDTIRELWSWNILWKTSSGISDQASTWDTN